MKDLLSKIRFIRNLIGLSSILFYCLYIGFNMYLNRGNSLINTLLILLTVIYIIFYVYSAFIDNNVKMNKRVKKTFKRGKKFLGFVNAVMIVASVFTSASHSFFTVFFAIISIFSYMMYLFFDILTSMIVRKFTSYKERIVNKYDHRN